MTVHFFSVLDDRAYSYNSMLYSATATFKTSIKPEFREIVPTEVCVIRRSMHYREVKHLMTLTHNSSATCPTLNCLAEDEKK